jgi:vitamin B12 transporter
VDFTVSGGYGQQTSLFMRGMNRTHTLVLVDGVRVGSATDGAFAWQFLPLSEVERIEIVRGPRASLYGADAMGGVIQIFTRGSKAAGISAEVAGGTYDTGAGNVALTNVVGDTRFTLSAGRVNSDGFDATTTANFGHEPDDDGYQNENFGLNVASRLSERTDLEAQLLRSQGRTDYDGTTLFGVTNQTNFVQQAASATVKYRPTDTLTLALRGGESRDDSDNLGNGVFDSTFNTERPNAALQADLAVGSGQLLTGGIDWYEDQVDSTTAYTETERYNRAVFFQYQGGFGSQDLLASIRRDDNEAFGGQTTGSLAWGAALAERMRVMLSAGTAFHAPTFNDLYFPGFSNPDLQPEESATYEAALRAGGDALHLDLSLYQTNADDLIVFDIATFTPQNVATARIRGVEAALGAGQGDLASKLTVTFLDPRDLDSGDYLPRRARFTGRFDLDWTPGDLLVGGSVIGQDSRFDDVANTVEVAGYVIANIRAEYAFARGWFARASVENLFDEQYETVATYNSPGRNALLTVGWNGKP